MLYRNVNIFFPDGQFHHGALQEENGIITAISENHEAPDGIDLENAYMIPGLVDIHTHGCMNHDFSDGDYDGLVLMAKYYARVGVTSFAPASLTLPYETLDKAYKTAARLAFDKPADAARLMGIHMEGPFFSPKKKGAQNGTYLRLPDYNAFYDLYKNCNGLIRIVDVAPELPGAIDFTAKASRLCTVSIAHTDSDYESACHAFDEGASHVTHLFNGMPSIHHRNPGVIEAASEREHVVAELICDGLHVHPSLVRMAFKLFSGRICLISDSLSCCGMPDGRYSIGGQDCFLSGNIARLSDGTIAGSAANVYMHLQNAVSFGIPMADAIFAATMTPAKEIGQDHLIGSLEPGKYADFVICDAKLNRKAVFIGGRQVM